MTLVKAKVSTVVPRQVPEFVREEHTQFIKFLEAYYEWMEQEGNAGYVIRNIESAKDIDKTVDDFVKFFTKELMIAIPEYVLSDKRLLAQRIKDLYKSKGTQQSYELLFRILFNEPAEIYYPKVDLLRSSDGKYDKRTVIKVIEITGNSFNLIGQQITQVVNTEKGIAKATAFVESVIKTTVGSFVIAEININATTIVGIFKAGSTITGFDNINDTLITVTSQSLIGNIRIDTDGSYYTIGQSFKVNGGSGTDLLCNVGTVQTGGITDIFVDTPGTNYRKGQLINFNNTDTGGYGAKAVIEEVDQTAIILETKVDALFSSGALSFDLGDITDNYVALPFYYNLAGTRLTGSGTGASFNVGYVEGSPDTYQIRIGNNINNSATANIISGETYTVASFETGTGLAQWQEFFSGLSVVPTNNQVITATATGALRGGSTVTYRIKSGVTYTISSLGNTTLAQWQQLFSGLASIPLNNTNITATASGTLAGGAIVVYSSAGNNYAVGDTIKILGSSVGGTNTTNDITVTVASLSDIEVTAGDFTINKTWKIIGTAINGTLNVSGTAGQFTSSIGSPNVAVNSFVTVTGTNSGTSTITGYASNTVYKISSTTSSSNTSTIVSGGVYTVSVVGTATLSDWQARFSSLSSIPDIGQTITATSSGTLAGTSRVTYISGFTLQTATGSAIVTTAGTLTGLSFSLFGSTTQVQWNEIAGTSGVSYPVGSRFTAAITGFGKGSGKAVATSIDTVTISGTARSVSVTADANIQTGRVSDESILYTNNSYMLLEDGGKIIPEDATQGGIVSVRVIDRGQFYNRLPIATAINTAVGSGTGTGAKLITYGEAIGRVTSVNITNLGVYYDAKPLVIAPVNAIIKRLDNTSFLPGETIFNEPEVLLLESGFNLLLEDEFSILNEDQNSAFGTFTSYDTNRNLLVIESNNVRTRIFTEDNNTLENRVAGSISATVATSGTAGQFTCGASTLAVDTRVTITGTNTGTGTITGYTTGTIYKISAITGNSTSVTGFTLTLEDGTAIVTTAGTLIGLTYTTETVTSITPNSGYVTFEDGRRMLTEDSGEFTNNQIIQGLVSGARARVKSIGNANVTAISSAVGKYSGVFIGSDGKLSESSKKMSDNLYYQEFSYVIKVGVSIDKYRDAVKRILHPIGLAMFGQVAIQSFGTASMPVASQTDIKRILNLSLRTIIDAKHKSVDHNVTLVFPLFVEANMRMHILASDFLPVLYFPRGEPLNVYVLDLTSTAQRTIVRQSIKTLNDGKHKSTDTNITIVVPLFAEATSTSSSVYQLVLKSQVDATILYTPQELSLVLRTFLDAKTNSLNKVVRIETNVLKANVQLVGGPTLGNLEKYKFFIPPYVGGTKNSLNLNRSAWTQSYPSPNNTYWNEYGTTQIKDFGNIVLSDVINNPNTKVNFCVIDAYIDILVA